MDPATRKIWITTLNAIPARVPELHAKRLLGRQILQPGSLDIVGLPAAEVFAGFGAKTDQASRCTTLELCPKVAGT